MKRNLFLNEWNKCDELVLLERWQCKLIMPRRHEPLENRYGLTWKTEHASETEDFESDPNIVKFAVVKKHEGDPAQKAELTSFEDAMLPHLMRPTTWPGGCCATNRMRRM